MNRVSEIPIHFSLTKYGNSYSLHFFNRLKKQASIKKVKDPGPEGPALGYPWKGRLTTQLVMETDYRTQVSGASIKRISLRSPFLFISN